MTRSGAGARATQTNSSEAAVTRECKSLPCAEREAQPRVRIYQSARAFPQQRALLIVTLGRRQCTRKAAVSCLLEGALDEAHSRCLTRLPVQ
eukprot:IDg1836t1